jgi:hypothetical protein
MRRIALVLTLAAATMVVAAAPAAASNGGSEAEVGGAVARSGGGFDQFGNTGQVAFYDLVPGPTCTQLAPDTFGIGVTNQGTVAVPFETTTFVIQRPPYTLPSLDPEFIPTPPIPAGGSVDVPVAIPDELRFSDDTTPFGVTVDYGDQVNEFDPFDPTNPFPDYESNNSEHVYCPPTST